MQVVTLPDSFIREKPTMRACWVVIGLCLLGCEGREPPATETPPSVADPATIESTSAPIAPAAPVSPARQYRDAAMSAAGAEYEQQMSLCPEAEDTAAC